MLRDKNLLINHGVVKMTQKYYVKPLEEQKHIKHIIKILGDSSKMKRSELVKLAQGKGAMTYNKKPFYQTVNRDVRRLVNKGFISIVGGGPRSQILSLSESGKNLLNKLKESK